MLQLVAQEDSRFGAWRSLAARLVWDQEAAGSNPAAPTTSRRPKKAGIAIVTATNITVSYTKTGSCPPVKGENS